MSQITKPLTSAGPIPTNIPTAFLTENGTANPVANIIEIVGDDTTANDESGITTAGGVVGAGDQREIQILLTNRIYGTATSTAGSNADIFTFPISANSVYRFTISVTGKSTAGLFTGEGVGYTLFASAKRIGGGASVVSVPFIDTDEDTDIVSSSISFIASGNNVILRAVGTASETVTYAAVANYVVI